MEYIALKDICKWLRINVPSNLHGKSGYEKLNKLFKKGNKVYIKGRKVSGLLDHINTDIIINSVIKELNPLIQEFK